MGEKKLRPQCTPGHEGHCMFAEGSSLECKCACNGVNHGIAIQEGLTFYSEAMKWMEENKYYEENEELA